MKKGLIILLTFISHFSFASINEKSKADTIVVSIEKQTKQAIDKYDNFFYLFPYVIVFDKQHLTGKEVINKHSLTDTLTTATFSTEDEYYLIQCKTLKKDVEVLVKKGDKVRINLKGDEIQVTIMNRATPSYEFKVDELLYLKNLNPTIPIKRYLNPLHFIAIQDALKFPNKKYIVKTQAFKEVPTYTKSATLIIDSLQTSGLISDITADFNRNKFNDQHLSLNILEGLISLDSVRNLIKERDNSIISYPDRYNYKLAERIVDKFFVEKAKEMKFNDFINRDYCEIYDELNKTNLFEARYKNHLLERELDRIIHSFSKNIGKKYYDLFMNTTSDTLLHKSVRNKHFSIFEVIDNQLELLSQDEKKYSFTNVASQNKFTYIDYWASWCGPCRAEMPHSKRLEEKYREKGINFIYISTDQNLTAWKIAANQIGLSDSKSYLLLKGNNSVLSKKYKISSIPRYMITDSNGQFINQDAPRPSDPKIRQIFDDLLKKK
jgi:thiol-disulfide isomerase/thioredoxin